MKRKLTVCKSLFKVCKESISSEFLFSFLFLVLLLIITSLSNNYDILFYNVHKSEGVNMIVEAYMDAYSDGNYFSITTGQNINRKVVEFDDVLGEVKIYEDSDVGHFTYNNDFNFYAYKDENMTEDRLKAMGVIETFNTLVPSQIEGFSMQDGGSYTGMYKYFEIDKLVYNSDIFEFIEKIHKNKLIRISEFIWGYLQYIFNGDGLLFLLTTCLGVVCVAFGSAFSRGIFFFISFVIFKKEVKFIEEGVNENDENNESSN